MASNISKPFANSEKKKENREKKHISCPISEIDYITL